MPDLLITAALVAVPVATLTGLLIERFMPLFRRYAMARPNARSSHRTPTPQGAGLAMLLAMVGWVALMPLLGLARVPAWTGAVLAAALGLAAVGALDDLRPLPALPRLLLQFLAVGAVLAAAPAEWAIAPDYLPGWLEKALAAVAGVWFVNLTNFMDGIDLITVAGFAPLSAALAALWMMGALGSGSAILALALLGGLLGFAPANVPPARIFLGDVGSLPIGLVSAAALYDLACHGGLLAAVLLPLYHVADATTTLLLRLWRRENVFQPHRDHAYQRAVDRGRSTLAVSRTVGLLNFGLAAIAIVAVVEPSWAWVSGAAALGGLAVATVILSFRFGRAS